MKENAVGTAALFLKGLWATNKALAKGTLAVVAVSVVVLVTAQFFHPASLPGLDEAVGTMMDKTFIGATLNWIGNREMHTPGVVVEYATTPCIALPMFQLGVALAWLGLLLAWGWVVLRDDIRYQKAKKNGAPAL
jgi:hypothetical protein